MNRLAVRFTVGRRRVVARLVERHPAVVQRLHIQLSRDRFEVRPRQGDPPAHEGNY